MISLIIVKNVVCDYCQGTLTDTGKKKEKPTKVALDLSAEFVNYPLYTLQSTPWSLKKITPMLSMRCIYKNKHNMSEKIYMNAVFV